MAVYLKSENRLPFHVSAYLQYKLRNLFSGAFDHDWDVTPLPVSIPMPTSRQVAQAAALLRKAKKPVFIVASQATLFDGHSITADEVRVHLWLTRCAEHGGDWCCVPAQQCICPEVLHVVILVGIPVIPTLASTTIWRVTSHPVATVCFCGCVRGGCIGGCAANEQAASGAAGDRRTVLPVRHGAGTAGPQLPHSHPPEPQACSEGGAFRWRPTFAVVEELRPYKRECVHVC